MPVSAHDPVLTNLRVFSFAVLSMAWMYTVNYRNLRYSCVVPFSPCLLRFSSILFLTPTPFAIGGIVSMAICLGATHKLVQKQQNEKWPGYSAELDLHPHHPHPDSVSVVVREKAPGGIISYRAPPVTPEKASGKVPIGCVETSGKIPISCVREGAREVREVRDVGVLGTQSGSVGMSQKRGGCVDTMGLCDVGMQDSASLTAEVPDLDYNTLFQMVLSENSA